MSVDMAAELARRAYTSDPANYPTSGTKPIRYDSWFDIVHKQRQYFVANTIEDIAKVFPDYELINSLGCQSVVNMPVVIGGELIGTVNMLDVEGHYTPERVQMIRDVLAVPAKLAALVAGR
jgi:GAF domain-containing protein